MTSPLSNNSVPIDDVRKPFLKAIKLLRPSYKCPDPDSNVEDHFSVSLIASNTREPLGSERTVPSLADDDDSSSNLGGCTDTNTKTFSDICV